jgi:hypothetical protein
MPKTKANPSSEQIEPLLATLDQVARQIPGCEHLRGKYRDLWSPRWSHHIDENCKEIRTDIRRSVCRWIRNASEEDIVETVQRLHPAARKALIKIIPLRHRGFFEFERGMMPNELAAPSPFLVINRRQGSWIPLREPIVRKYGSTRMEIKGVAVTPDDGKTMMALLQLRKQKKCGVTKKNISFTTSLTEIAQT